jgi:hypothetical protein
MGAGLAFPGRPQPRGSPAPSFLHDVLSPWNLARVEAALANLLWFLRDPEAEDFEEDPDKIIEDAVACADALGVHWRSGR